MTYEELESKLIASQLREKGLREALVQMKGQVLTSDEWGVINSALSLPTDTTEADALLARVKELEDAVAKQAEAIDLQLHSNHALVMAKARIIELEEHCIDYAAQAVTDAKIIKSDGKEIHFLREQLTAARAVIEEVGDILSAPVKSEISFTREQNALARIREWKEGGREMSVDFLAIIATILASGIVAGFIGYIFGYRDGIAKNKESGKMSGYPTRLDICDGKYTLLIDMGSGKAECLRYGEKWRSLVGDKMVLALFDTVVEKESQITQLRAEVAKLRNNLERAYEARWCKSAAWSGETHLLADIGSSAYIEDRDDALVDIT